MSDYTAKTWFQQKCGEGDDRSLWIKARIFCTFRRGAITCLYLFQRYTHNAEQETPRTSFQRAVWCPEVHRNIRILLDRIVTRWTPRYLSQGFGTNAALHNSLTPVPLLTVPQIFDDPQGELDFDVEDAQELYEQCFVPLLYHELWEGIKHDAKSIISNNFSDANEIINIEMTRSEPQLTQPAHPSELPQPTTLVFGSYSFDVDLGFTRTFPKLSLGDILLISINLHGQVQRSFAVVVHINDHWPASMQTIPMNDLSECNNKENIIRVQCDIVLYTSKRCSDVIAKYHTSIRSNTIPVIKLSNFTSSRRHISAVYNLRTLSKQRSLLLPVADDRYFHGGDAPDVPIEPEIAGNFNENQKNVIKCAERIFRDKINDHLHLVHGPPGLVSFFLKMFSLFLLLGTGKSKTIAGIVTSLLPQLKRNRKILLCAPSNNACDELFKRILNEPSYESMKGQLVRVGREAPLDYHVCEHFLESLIMQELVRMMQSREPITDTTVDSVKASILRKAKVIVSTLNYSANSTLLLMKHRKNVDFVIIDEACQSLEPDCLLPFYFGCVKVILVGDPRQLPPCVLSVTGQGHNLSQSLYSRLYDIVPTANISMLTEQYRMHEEICRFPNRRFYVSQLTTHESVTNYWSDYPLKAYYLCNLTYTTHQCPPDGGSSSNKEERIFIKQFCIKLLECLVGRQPYLPDDPEFIAMEKRIVVITPYKSQMTKFRKQSLQFPRHIEVLTVDGAQGKEKDIVLISCVRSGEGRSIGFLNDEHRLNVMLTRAKRALYIFGNLDWLAERNSHWDALFDDAAGRQLIETVPNSNHEVNLPFKTTNPPDLSF